MTIALDAMGGDHGPQVVVPAAVQSLKKHSDLHIILVGLKKELDGYLAKLDYPAERLDIHHASEIVVMDEAPMQALRKKKDSSMRVAINLMDEGVAHACVSAGNTGALMAIARYKLKTLPGIDRPAIMARVPSACGFTHILDLGANVDSSAVHLRDFAVMGSVLASAVENIDNPKVALLNIGEEEIKGNAQVKQAAHLISKADLNYAGFAEGNDIFLGDLDVIVCDGFVGNAVLKSSEGAAQLIASTLKEAFRKTLLTRLSACLASPALTKIKNIFDPGNYNGASLLGLRGIVVKSHGNADIFAFSNAISTATREIEKQVPEAICVRLDEALS